MELSDGALYDPGHVGHGVGEHGGLSHLQRHVEAKLCTGLGDFKAGVHQLVHHIERLKPCVISGIQSSSSSKSIKDGGNTSMKGESSVITSRAKDSDLTGQIVSVIVLF